MERGRKSVRQIEAAPKSQNSFWVPQSNSRHAKKSDPFYPAHHHSKEAAPPPQSPGTSFTWRPREAEGSTRLTDRHRCHKQLSPRRAAILLDGTSLLTATSCTHDIIKRSLRHERSSPVLGGLTVWSAPTRDQWNWF